MDIPESTDKFKQVFYEHYPAVRRKLAALVRDDTAADDLAQEVFLKLYRNPPDDPQALGAWLHRVLTRTGYDYLNKKARERLLQARQEIFYDTETAPPSGGKRCSASWSRRMSASGLTSCRTGTARHYCYATQATAMRKLPGSWE